MPKGKLKDIKPFSEAVFKKLLKEKGYTIEGFANEVGIGARTIGRAMKSGEIKRVFFDDIAQKLNIRPSVLAGTYPPLKAGALSIEKMNLSFYPYCIERDNDRKYYLDFLNEFLSYFNVTGDDIENLDIEARYEMYRDIVLAIDGIICKYIQPNPHQKPSEINGIESLTGTEAMLDALEYDKTWCYEIAYADETLRQEFLKNPPKGYTKKQIKKMAPEELSAIEMLHNKSNRGVAEKYKDFMT